MKLMGFPQTRGPHQAFGGTPISMELAVHRTSQSRRGLHPGALLCAFLVALAFVAASVPVTAEALSVSKATARPNEDGGSSVIGGIATRLTWEGTVDDGEEVSSVTLSLPDDASFDGSSTKVTVLEGLTRISTDATATANGNSVTIDFAEPVAAGSLLRIEIEGMEFPSAGGDVSVSGTYTNDEGTQTLEDSPAITTIANTPLQAAVSWLDNQAWVEAWNSVPFLNMFLKPQVMLTSFASLFSGWLVCLTIVVLCYPFAIVLGLLFAFMKISKHRLVRAIAVVYINILRGTPLFLQIYILFFGLPMLNINVNNYLLGGIAMAVNSSAYLAEIFRAGIQSIPKGQYEAASSLGMNYRQTMLSIILPQTIRRVLPTVTSDFITAYKDTSLLSSVGVMELMMYSKNLTTVTGNITPYMTAAIYYLIVTLPLIKVVTIVEHRLARSEAGGGPRPKGGAATQDESMGVEEGAGLEGGLHAEGEERTSRAMDLLAGPFRFHPVKEGGADA